MLVAPDAEIMQKIPSSATDIWLELEPNCVDANFSDTILASHIESKAFWPSIKCGSDKYKLVLSFDSMAKS